MQENLFPSIAAERMSKEGGRLDNKFILSEKH
jgi:hypothetical protein